MEIRCMTMGDYPEVYALWSATPGIGLREFDDSEAGIRRFLRRNPATCFVAVDQGRIAGVVLGGHDGRRGCLYHMAVRAGSRRRGVGRALAAAVVEALRREQIFKVSLVAFAGNEAGQAFWQELGFSRRSDLVVHDREIIIAGSDEAGPEPFFLD